MLTPNSPMKRLKYVAKTYGPRSPGVVLDTFFLLSDLAGIERPRMEGPYADLWYIAGFKRSYGTLGSTLTSTVGERVDPMSLHLFLQRRKALWRIGPDAPIVDATIPEEGNDSPYSPWTGKEKEIAKRGLDRILEYKSQREVMEGLIRHLEASGTEGMFRRMDSDPIWPWVARALNRAKKVAVKSGDAVPYVEILDAVQGKGPALALWQEQERIDLNKTNLREALIALETFEPDIDVEQGEIVFEWDDGWTVQKLTQEDQLVEEGEIMQHCVGSYCEEVTEGDTTIYSLRDPDGKPHATMEVKAGHTRFEQVQGKQNKPPKPDYQERIDEFGKAEGIGPAGLTEAEREAAALKGTQLAEFYYDESHDSIVDRDGGYPYDIDETVVADVFYDDHVAPDSDLYDEARDLILQTAEDRWEEMWEASMQELDDMAVEVREEAQSHLEAEGDLSDFDFEEVARSYIWDIRGAGPSDAMHIAGEAASHFDEELFEPREDDEDDD